MTTDVQPPMPGGPWFCPRGITQYGWEVYLSVAGRVEVQLYCASEYGAQRTRDLLNGVGTTTRAGVIHRLEAFERAIAEEFEPEGSGETPQL